MFIIGSLYNSSLLGYKIEMFKVLQRFSLWNFKIFKKFNRAALKVTVIGNGIGDPSSNPGQGCLCFTSN